MLVTPNDTSTFRVLRICLCRFCGPFLSQALLAVQPMNPWKTKRPIPGLWREITKPWTCQGLNLWHMSHGTMLVYFLNSFQQTINCHLPRVARWRNGRYRYPYRYHLQHQRGVSYQERVRGRGFGGLHWHCRRKSYSEIWKWIHHEVGKPNQSRLWTMHSSHTPSSYMTPQRLQNWLD